MSTAIVVLPDGTEKSIYELTEKERELFDKAFAKNKTIKRNKAKKNKNLERGVD